MRSILPNIPQEGFVSLDAAVYSFERFLFGFWGCQIEGALLNFAGGAALTGHNLISLNRYQAVVQGKPKPFTAWQQMVVVNWIMCLAMAFLPYILGTTYVIQPGDMYCMVAVGSNSAIEILNGLLVLIFLSSAMVVTSFVYLQILRRLRNSKSRKTSTAAPSSGHTQTAQAGGKFPGMEARMAEVERQLTRRGLVSSSVFFGTSLPMVAQLVCALAGQQFAVLYALSSTMVIIMPTLNPVLTLSFDRRLLRAAKSIFTTK